MRLLTQEKIRNTLHSPREKEQARYAGMLNAETMEKYRQAAVIMPLLFHDREWQLLFTRRSEFLPEHRGQVSFPGGAWESGDECLLSTALREMQEEIGIKPQDVDVLGYLGEMPIVTGYRVQIYVGEIPWPYPLTLNSEEVESAFIIPLSWLAEPENRRIQSHNFEGNELPLIFYDLYEGHQLWGASAEMTALLLETLGLVQ